MSYKCHSYLNFKKIRFMQFVDNNNNNINNTIPVSLKAYIRVVFRFLKRSQCSTHNYYYYYYYYFIIIIIIPIPILFLFLFSSSSSSSSSSYYYYCYYYYYYFIIITDIINIISIRTTNRRGSTNTL